GGVAGVYLHGNAASLLVRDIVLTVFKTTLSGVIPAYIGSKINLKGYTGRKEIEDLEKLVVYKQKEAMDAIVEFHKHYPIKWLYMVQSPARCLDHEENGDKLPGQKEEVRTYSDNNSTWYICFRAEPTPKEIIDGFTGVNLEKSLVITATSTLLGAAAYALITNYFPTISVAIKIGLSLGTLYGSWDFIENSWPMHHVIDFEQLYANKYIEEHKHEKDLYLAQAPGSCSKKDLAAEYFNDDNHILKWTVCEIVGSSANVCDNTEICN
ncbi:MAG: hypothetical protein AABY27_02200, partial [Pseudomonadota bacterium]